MARTPSTMVALGTPAPDFRLPDTVTGTMVGLSDFAAAKALAVMFICNHCPYVVHVKDELAAIGRDYGGRGAAFVAICSNDVTTHPDDGPGKMKAFAEANGFTFPYCYDESQAVAKAYRAACTPDFYVFDGERRLAYRGELDGSRPGNGVAVTGENLRAALDAVLAGRPAPGLQKPSLGCNIKWKAGGAPDYA